MFYIGEFLDWLTYATGYSSFDGMSWLRFWAYH